MTDSSDPFGAASIGLWRLLDASINRASEGLRVAEDIWRFVINEPVMTRAFKDLRHQMADLVQGLNPRALAAARDVGGDPGRTISTPQELRRTDARDLLAANIKRAEQALRSMEECLKTLQSESATAAERLRYRVYELESAGVLYQLSHQRLSQCRLCVLVDGRESTAAFESFMDDLIASGVDMIQLRDKRLDDRELIERAAALRQKTRHGRVLFVMNDRPDLAVICQADGVHLGQSDLPVAAARRIVGTSMLVGVSTHSPMQAEQAVLDGADYIGVGPIFASATKSFGEVLGPELIAQVSAMTNVPQFAIGGINAGNLDSVLSAGAKRVAVSSAVLASENPADAARELVKLLADGLRYKNASNESDCPL